MVSLKHENIVKYYDHYHDNEFTYIKMELCLCDLKTFLEKKFNAFHRTVHDNFTLFEYAVSCQIIKELSEAINYLHQCEPNPIMHRDLKPTNILISIGKDGNFVKICDFGLSKKHEVSSNSSKVGNVKYMALEVMNGRKYNMKADVFSLALISLELIGLKFDMMINM